MIILDRIEEAGKRVIGKSKLVKRFSDYHYHRTNFTYAGFHEDVIKVVHATCVEALKRFLTIFTIA